MLSSPNYILLLLWQNFCGINSVGLCKLGFYINEKFRFMPMISTILKFKNNIIIFKFKNLKLLF